MQIIVNGESRLVEPAITVAELVAQMSLAGKRIAVERNGQIVPRSQHPLTGLDDGDRIEIVVAVGGG
jgi:sulfur carrier protein